MTPQGPEPLSENQVIAKEIVSPLQTWRIWTKEEIAEKIVKALDVKDAEIAELKRLGEKAYEAGKLAALPAAQHTAPPMGELVRALDRINHLMTTVYTEDKPVLWDWLAIKDALNARALSPSALKAAPQLKKLEQEIITYAATVRNDILIKQDGIVYSAQCKEWVEGLLDRIIAYDAALTTPQREEK